MKRALLILLLVLNSKPLLADVNIVYLDVQYIIDKSNLGKFYKNEINIIKKEKYSVYICMFNANYRRRHGKLRNVR